ncbi:MAG: PHP domain-containing protein, partial [Pseudonocardiaceae bacterium]
MAYVRIDLHAHSSVSDGTDTPAQLVAAAAAAGLDVVALTDHDTTAGWDDAVDALPPGLRLIRGAE